MKKKEVINFAPEGVKSKKRLPGYVTAIILVCILAFLISIFIILAKNDFNIGKALGAREAQELIQEETTKPPEIMTAPVYADLQKEEESTNFLVLCTDKKEFTFCQMIAVLPKENRIMIRPLAPDFKLTSGGKQYTLDEIYYSVGGQELVKAFADAGMPVDRYVYLSEENFVRVMKNIGTTPIEIGEDCEFNIDAVKYTFRKGTQNLTSDMLLKYLKFAASGSEKLRLQANATADIFKKHFTAENFSKGDELFSSLINNVDSNITAFDYDAARSTIETMLNGKTQITVIG